VSGALLTKSRTGHGLKHIELVRSNASRTGNS
jgi:hypothetical protein